METSGDRERDGASGEQQNIPNTFVMLMRQLELLGVFIDEERVNVSREDTPVVWTKVPGRLVVTALWQTEMRCVDGCGFLQRIYISTFLEVERQKQKEREKSNNLIQEQLPSRRN